MHPKYKHTAMKKDIVIAVIITAAVSYCLIAYDFFDWWYDYTREQEDWELDELLAVFFAILLAGTILSIRHIFTLNKLTKKLQNAHDTIAKKMSVEGHQEKLIAIGELSSGLAHEINNALQPTLGLGEFIKDGLKKSGNEKHLSYMETILDSAAHARQVTENVLAFSYEKETEATQQDAFYVLSRALKFCTNILPSTMTFNVSGLPDEEGMNKGNKATAPVTMNCDQTEISQIFMNVLKNSAAAMNHKGQIDIAFKQTRIPFSLTSAIRMTVTDTGYGMNEQTRARIFEPFFTTKEIDKGTGLGLSTVYSLITKYGGDITVTSEEGKGTIFTLFFPIVTKDDK